MSKLMPLEFIAYVTIIGHKCKVPPDWKPPTNKFEAPERDQYAEVMQLQRGGSTQAPTWLLFPADAQRYFVDACKEMSDGYADFVKTMLKAVVHAHDMWKLRARLTGLQIQGPCAVGQGGCLSGPKLEKDIKRYSGCMSWDGNQKKWRDAVAKGVSKCFSEWQRSVTVPGYPWFPAYTCFPSPQTPPMPNIPMPLIALVSSSIQKITDPKSIYRAIVKAHKSDLKDNDTGEHYKAVFEGIANSLSLAFLLWLCTQVVSNVMCRGPVPSWTPTTPMGPVVMGASMPKGAQPPHFA